MGDSSLLHGKMEWVNTSHHYVFENLNRFYDFMRRTIVKYGADATNHLKRGIMNAVLRKDVFEVQSKVKTLQGTGIPVFVLRPSEYVERIEDAFVASTSVQSPQGSSPHVDSVSPPSEPLAGLQCSVFSQDVSLFVTGHYNGSIMVWDAQHGKLKKRLFGPHRQPIADLVFYKNTRFLVACDFTGLMSIWDVADDTREPVVVNCSANWETTRMPSVEGHWPKLCRQGKLLVCPVQVVLEQQPGQPRDVTKSGCKPRLSSINTVKKIDLLDRNTRSRSGRPGVAFAHFCILHIFDTRAEGITKDAPFGDSEGKQYCWGKSINLSSMTRLYIPLLADSHDYSLSSTEISFDSRGLLIGVSSRPNGHLIVWPDFKSKEMHSYRLDGMVGRWSPCNNFIASWDIPLKNSLKTEVGACRIWDVERFVELAERCHQNGNEEHPRFVCKPIAELACPTGNHIYWCDFISLAPETVDLPQHMGVATCSIGESLQLVLWDFKLGVPVQTFCPGISRKDISLHTQQAWADKWVLVRPSWGLNFISTSADRSRIGFLSTHSNKGIIYDTEKRIEKLWITLTDKAGNVDESLVKSDMDFILSPRGDRFVTLCEDVIMIWLPQVLQGKEERGASWISLDSSDNELADGKLRCKFSRDGNCIGLMRLYGSVMDIWNLQTGQRIILAQANPEATGTISSPFQSYEQNPEEGGSLSGTPLSPLSPLSPTRGVAAAQKKWLCQFCISKHGDRVATCMGDMSVLLWDLTTTPPTHLQIATLDSRYCAAWAVCFTEGPTGEPDSVVVCEDTGCLVWIAVHPYPRFVARKDADGKKRCAFSADGRKAVLMPDDIQVRVWDLLDRVPIFSCTYRVWLGRSGVVPFPHNISIDGKKAMIGLDTAGKTVLSNPETTYAEMKEKPDQEKLCLVPQNIAVNENMTWFVTDEFHEFDFDVPKKRPAFRRGRRMYYNRLGSVASSSSARGGLSIAGTSKTRGSAKVKFSQSDDGLEVESMPPPPEPAEESSGSVQYPNIRERLLNEQLWDYLRENPPMRKDSEDEFSSEKLVVMSMNGEGSTKQIFFSNLDPRRFIVMSDDGTKIACMDQENKLNVWSAHAAYGCIPTSQMLLRTCTSDVRFLERELDTYGPGIVNYQDRTGLTLLMYAVYKKDVTLLKCLLSWAKRRDVNISLRDELTDQSRGRQVLNALNLALGFRSPEVTRSIMKYLLEGICTEIETSVILKDSLVKLSGVYPSILLKILDNKRIMMRLHEMTVPEWAFARSEYKVEASNQLIPTPTALEEMWLQKKLARHEGIFRRPAFKRTSAYACVMPYPDIAQLGMRGILRPLLFNKVPHHVFATWPIRCVIKFKWGLYGKRLIVEDCVHYLALLFFFTLYALLIGFFVDQKDNQSLKNTHFYADGTVAVLSLCVFLALGTLMRKFHQMHVLWDSGRWKGIWYWFTDYFNLLELLCYILIVLLVPMAHIRDVRSRSLASLVASACILLWAKTLYYAQAFKGTGPLVIMIREIVKDIRFYLFLLFAMLMGFAIAFFVLFRNARFETCDEIGNPGTKDGDKDLDLEARLEECNKTTEDINALFGSFDKTLITMFSMMLGEVSDAAELLFKVGTGLKLVGIVMFALYLLAVSIVLLNLLIAIMGDGFDRVKATDMSYFLKKRAQIIDDMELGLTKDRQEEISSQIGTYLHVLMPKHKSELQQQTGEWQGRMKDVQHRFKQDILKAFQQYSEVLKDIKENQSRLERKIEDLGNASSTFAARVTSEGMSTTPSRGHGGGRPIQLADVSEGSDLDDLFGDDSDGDTV